MDKCPDELSKIKEILKANPRGATVSDIARMIKLNRNSASKYLEMLVVSGEVEMKMQGPSKVYFLSRRVPISAMLSFSSDLILVLDSRLYVQYANDRFAEFAQRPLEEIKGRHIQELRLELFSHDETVAMLKEALDGLQITRELSITEGTSAHHWKGRFVPTVLNDGQAGVTAIIEDITERKQWEEALQASEKKYRQLVELAHEGILAVDSATTITFVNPRMAEMVGYPATEMIGQPLWMILDAEPRKIVEEKLERRRKGFGDEYDIPLKRKDGKTIYASVRTTPLTDEKGNYAGAFSVVSDVTGRKMAEDALKASEEKYRQIVELAQEGIWAVDGDCRTTFVNRRMAEMLGCKPEEMLGRACDEIIDPGHIAIANEHMRRRRAGIRERFDTTLHTCNGRTITACISTSPILDKEGNFAGAISLVTDITERKRMEVALKQASTELQAMVSEQTKELEETAQVLRQEIAERKLIEEAWRLDEARLEALMALGNMEHASIQEMADFAINKAVEITGSKYGLINTIDEEKRLATRFSYSKDVFRICRMDDHSGIFHMKNGGLWSLPALRKKPVMINDYAAFAGKKGTPEGHFMLRRLLGVPVFDGETVTAVVMVANKETDYTAADMRQLTLLAGGLWKSILQKQAKEALGKSEEQFRQLAENITEVFWIGSPDWKQIHYVSPAFETVWGQSADNLYREPLSWLDAILPEDRPGLESNLERRKKGDWSNPSASEYRIMRPDGSIRWILARSYPIRDASGGICRIAGLAEDITERKLMEARLLESEQTFRYTFDQSPLGAAIADLDYRYVRVNESLCRFLGYTAEELLARDMPEITHPDDVEPNLKLARQIAAGEITEYHMDKRYVRKDGKIVWGRLSGRMVRDATGRPLYYLALVEDIDDRKQMEGKLLESEQQFRYTFDQSPLGAAILDLDCRYTRVNAAFCKMLGYAAEELLARTMPEITHPDDVEHNLKLACCMAAGKLEEYHLEKRFIRKDGEEVWARQWSRMVRDATGRPLYYIALIEGIDGSKAPRQPGTKD